MKRQDSPQVWLVFTYTELVISGELRYGPGSTVNTSAFRLRRGRRKVRTVVKNNSICSRAFTDFSRCRLRIAGVFASGYIPLPIRTRTRWIPKIFNIASGRGRVCVRYRKFDATVRAAVSGQQATTTLITRD